MIRLATVFYLISITFSFADEEVLFCVEDKAAGISMKAGQMKSFVFEPQRFKAKVPKSSSSEALGILGKVNYKCQRIGDLLICENKAQGSYFRLKEDRFALVKGLAGHVHNENGSDLIVSSGRCEKF